MCQQLSMDKKDMILYFNEIRDMHVYVYVYGVHACVCICIWCACMGASASASASVHMYGCMYGCMYVYNVYICVIMGAIKVF